MTSNHNEAIHSILFRMVPKADPVGNDIMALVSALTVIRYNDGLRGIQEVFESVGITPGHHLLETIRGFDIDRIRMSARIITEQPKKCAKKQRRGKKTKKQVNKHGEGYGSGALFTEKT